jgi:hypothetical protein
MGIVDRFSKGEATPTNTENYLWGTNCDGWHLLKRDDLSIITERVPPGESEQRHFHPTFSMFFCEIKNYTSKTCYVWILAFPVLLN